MLDPRVKGDLYEGFNCPRKKLRAGEEKCPGMTKRSIGDLIGLPKYQIFEKDEVRNSTPASGVKMGY